MHRLILSLILSSLFILGKAQVDFGVKVGLVASDLRIHATAPYDKTLFNFSESFTPMVGLSMFMPLSDQLSFMPEIELKAKGYRQSVFQESHFITYLSVPLLVRYDPNSKLFITGGPDLAFALTQHTKVNGKLNHGGMINIGFDFALDLGIGTKIKEDFEIGLRYNPSLTNLFSMTLTDDTGEPTSELTAYHSAIQLEFRYFLRNKAE